MDFPTCKISKKFNKFIIEQELNNFWVEIISDWIKLEEIWWIEQYLSKVIKQIRHLHYCYHLPGGSSQNSLIRNEVIIYRKETKFWHENILWKDHQKFLRGS